MAINTPSLAIKAKYTYNLSIGNLYFYDNIIITEIHEGEIIGKEAFLKIFSLIEKHFGINKPYGLISHRVYSYSIDISELLQIPNKFKHLVANALVAYSDHARKNFELEKQLLQFKGETFTTLQDAYEWTKKEVNNLLKI